MENAYAQALWKMVESGMDHKKAVASLRDILHSENRESLFPRIARAFERIAMREHAKNNITLTIADAAHERHAKKEATQAIQSLGLTGKEVKTRIDPTLIGGWRLEGAEHLIDASYKKQLLTIFGQVTQ